MPTNSRLQVGFAFATPTGRAVKSERKKVTALMRFFRSEGHSNDVDGVHLIGRWCNPEDKSFRSQIWKTTDDFGQSLPDFYETLKAFLNSRIRPDVESKYANLPRTNKVQRPKGGKPKRNGGKIPPVAKRKTTKKRGSVSGSGMGKQKGKSKKKGKA